MRDNLHKIAIKQISPPDIDIFDLRKLKNKFKKNGIFK